MDIRHFFSLRKVRAEAAFKRTLLITSIAMIVNCAGYFPHPADAFDAFAKGTGHKIFVGPDLGPG